MTTVNRFLDKAKLYARAERTVFLLTARDTGRRVTLFAFGALFALFALAMAHAAAFLWLTPRLGGLQAVAIIGGVDAFIAILFVMASRSSAADSDLAAARAVRDILRAQVKAEVEETVDNPGPAVAQLARQAIGGSMAGAIADIVYILLRKPQR